MSTLPERLVPPPGGFVPQKSFDWTLKQHKGVFTISVGVPRGPTKTWLLEDAFMDHLGPTANQILIRYSKAVPQDDRS